MSSKSATISRPLCDSTATEHMRAHLTTHPRPRDRPRTLADRRLARSPTPDDVQPVHHGARIGGQTHHPTSCVLYYHPHLLESNTSINTPRSPSSVRPQVCTLQQQGPVDTACARTRLPLSRVSDASQDPDVCAPRLHQLADHLLTLASELRSKAAQPARAHKFRARSMDSHHERVVPREHLI